MLPWSLNEDSCSYDLLILLEQRLPGLDGLRALAVTLVVAYHLWPEVLPGGFVGVSLFFALSGFLITRLLRSERDRTGGVAIAAFYRRRTRRLLPASLLVLFVVVSVWSILGWMSNGLRVEVNFTLVQLANWGQIVEGYTYGTGEVASPIMHYWSLAIEEQAYLVLPLLVAAVARARTLALIVLVGVGISAFSTVVLAGDRTVIYFATFTRMGEILAGSLLALVPVDRIMPRFRRVLPVVVAVSMLLIFCAAVLWSVESGIVYLGGLLGVGFVSAVLVLAVTAAPGIGRWLDAGPLRWIGEHSYGIYLIHWPVLVGLAGLGVSRIQTTLITLVGTLVLASLMARVVEHRFRFGVVRRRQTLILAMSMMVAVVLIAGIGQRAVDDRIDLEQLARQTEELIERSTGSQTAQRGALRHRRSAPAAADSAGNVDLSPARPSLVTQEASLAEVPRLDEPLRYSYIGDSKAVLLLRGLLDDPPPGWVLADSQVVVGCPLGRTGSRRHNVAPIGLKVWDVGGCDWTPMASSPQSPADVAVVWFGTWDAAEAAIPELGEQWLDLDDPNYWKWLVAEVETMVELLVGERDVSVVVFPLTPHSPHFVPDAMIDRWNQLLFGIAWRQPSRVVVVDVVGWAASTGSAEQLLPDGIHLGETAESRRVAARRLHDELITPAVEALLARSG